MDESRGVRHAGTVTQTQPLVIDDGERFVEVTGLDHDYALGDRVSMVLAEGTGVEKGNEPGGSLRGP